MEGKLGAAEMPLLYSTLESEVAVRSPETGTGIGAGARVGPASYVEAREGKGLLFSDNLWVYLTGRELPPAVPTVGSLAMGEASRDNHLYVGNRSDTSNYHANGTLDEVRVFDVVIQLEGPVEPSPREGYEVTGARLFKSGPAQITADGKWLWVANEDHDSVSRIDTETELADEFPLPFKEGGHAPRGLSVREDGAEVWVACHDSDLLYVLGNEGEVLEVIRLPYGSGPHSVALSRDQKRALVTLHRAAGVALVDVEERKVAQVVDGIFWTPTGIAWEESDGGAWVTHLFAPGEHPFLTRVEVEGMEARISSSIRVTAADPRHSSRLTAPYDVAEGGYLTTRGHPAQIPSASGRKELWLPTQYNNITEDRYTPDSTVQSALRHVDLERRVVLEENEDKVILTALHVHEPRGNGSYVGPGWNAQVSGPVDIGFSEDGRVTMLLHELSNDLVVMPSDTPGVKLAGAAPLVEIEVGNRPMGMAVSPVAPVVYVFNLLSRDVSVVDLKELKEVKRIGVTQTPEPFGSMKLLGAQLFHTSADPRISQNNKVSCASCHINGETDGRSWALHRLPGRHGPREVPSLLGLNRTFGARDPATGWGQLHRSGDRDEIQDFEHTFQSLTMGGSGFLGTGANPELGPPNAGRSQELDAIAGYLLALEPLQKSPYREEGGSLSEAAVRGATFFLGNDRMRKRADAGCAACHVPETGFVDFKFHDVGSRRPSEEQELNNRRPAWHVNTPTLTGLWATAPFNGTSTFSEATSVNLAMISLLQDMAGRAGAGNRHGTPDGLTDRQLADLAEFVLSIDGRMTAEEIRSLKDDRPPKVVRVEPASATLLDVWFNESVSQRTAGDARNWRLTDLRNGERVAVQRARWDGKNGDRVTLFASMKVGREYELRALGSIADLAGMVSGGESNLLDEGDPANTVLFRLNEVLTVRLGASGYENLSIPVHDAGMVGPGLSTWSHDSLWLFPTRSQPGVNSGFVRFDWQTPFQAASGVANPDLIRAASFSLQGEFGDEHELEIRRVLQRWSDPAQGNDWNRNADGGPTWRDHSHPSGRWNRAGAGALGGTGGRISDYNRSWDLAQRVDARTQVRGVNARVWFEGPGVTDAFRFWFENPSLDYGYAVRQTGSPDQAIKFERWEAGLNGHGPVLELSYVVPVAEPELQIQEDAGDVVISWPVGAVGFHLEESGSLNGGWMEHNGAVTDVKGRWEVRENAGGAARYFRLAKSGG